MCIRNFKLFESTGTEGKTIWVMPPHPDPLPRVEREKKRRPSSMSGEGEKRRPSPMRGEGGKKMLEQSINILKTSSREGELKEESIIRKFRITAQNGKSYETQYFKSNGIRH
jgi:hypothetical protein